MPEWAMPEWLKILVSALGGVALAGVFQLALECLRHKWRRAEKYQDLLIEKRFHACNTLLGMIGELLRSIDPLRFGAKTLLSLPTTQEEESEWPAGQLAQAEIVEENLTKLSRFVTENQMLLGPKVLKAWYLDCAALRGLQLALNTGRPHGVVLIALQKFLPPFSDAIASAIEEELGEAGVEFLLSDERATITTQEGFPKAERLLTEADDWLHRGSKDEAGKV